MKKLLLTFFVLFSLFSASVPAFAQVATSDGQASAGTNQAGTSGDSSAPALQDAVLPATNLDEEECHYILDNDRSLRKQFRGEKLNSGELRISGFSVGDLISCAVKTGRFHLWMFPFVIYYAIRFLSLLAGMLCVLFIVIGGYHFALGPVVDEKEKGKKTILYALGGFALSLLAYTIVNLVQVAVTS